MKEQNKVLLKDKKYMIIKKRMKEFHSAFDRSLNQRHKMNAYKKDSEEYKILFEKVIESEIRCIELDEIIFRLYKEYVML